MIEFLLFILLIFIFCTKEELIDFYKFIIGDWFK